LCIKFAGTEAVDDVADTSYKLTQLYVVVFRYHRARRPSLRFVSHDFEVTHELAAPSGTRGGKTRP
jgi:hypothetical protein